MTHRRVRFVTLTLALALATSVVGAQPATSFQQSEARTHFQTGAQHYQNGQYGQAIEQFETAYRLFPSPVILFNLAQAYRSDGRLSESVTTFRRFLTTSERLTPEQRRDVESTIAEIEASRASITFEVEPAGATLSIDGRAIGTLPLTRPLELQPGDHQVSIALTNYQTRRDNVTLQAHDQRLYTATLRPVAQNARITVTTTPTDATITLDGTDVSQGTATQVEPGTHTVVVTHEGYVQQSSSVRVSAFGSETANINLERQGRSIFTRPVFWAVVGGVAVVGVVLAIVLNPPQPTPIMGNVNPSVAQTIFSF